MQHWSVALHWANQGIGLKLGWWWSARVRTNWGLSWNAENSKLSWRSSKSWTLSSAFYDLVNTSMPSLLKWKYTDIHAHDIISVGTYIRVRVLQLQRGYNLEMPAASKIPWYYPQFYCPHSNHVSCGWRWWRWNLAWAHWYFFQGRTARLSWVIQEEIS